MNPLLLTIWIVAGLAMGVLFARNTPTSGITQDRSGRFLPATPAEQGLKILVITILAPLVAVIAAIYAVCWATGKVATKGTTNERTRQ